LTSPCRRAGSRGGQEMRGVYRASRLRARDNFPAWEENPAERGAQRQGRRRRLFSTFRLTRFGSGQQTELELGPYTSSSQAHDNSGHSASSSFISHTKKSSSFIYFYFITIITMDGTVQNTTGGHWLRAGRVLGAWEHEPRLA